jgi:hypothetical protein
VAVVPISWQGWAMVVTMDEVVAMITGASANLAAPLASSCRIRGSRSGLRGRLSAASATSVGLTSPLDRISTGEARSR